MIKSSSPLFALEINVGEGALTGNFDTRVSVGASWRVQNRDKAFIGISNGGRSLSVNGDDGNLNYSKGSVSELAKVSRLLWRLTWICIAATGWPCRGMRPGPAS